MKKKNMIWFVFVLSLLTAYQRTENHAKNASTNSHDTVDISDISTDGLKKIKAQLSSGVIVNAELKVPEAAELEDMPVYSASLQELPFDKFSNSFAKNRSVIEKTEQPSEDNIGNGSYKYYQLEDGSTLTYNGGIFLHYSSAKYRNIQVDFEIENDEEDSFNKDFDFETRELADKKIREIFRDLGLEVAEECKSYSIDYKWLQEKNQMPEYPDIAEKIQIEMEEIVWSNKLDCYLFRYFGSANNMPITNQLREEKGILIPAPGIYVVYSRDGIEQIDISNCFQIENEENRTSVYGVNEILDVLDEKYNSIILEGNYSVDKLQLEYVPIETAQANKYQLIPAWRIYVSHEINIQNKDDPSKSEVIALPTQILFNAIDGTELQTGVGM